MLSTQPDPLPTPMLHTVLIHTAEQGGIGEPVRSLEGRQFTRGVENTNISVSPVSKLY
jgi:hypothetical protein